ncbi:nitrate- and nitrite sensing domain-containing protein [Streptomyces sp. NPDC058045]|uniref:sensor histidine kinase n=1 Tax=Streptomyces sp. NPDC058045 TaxID=3346311 RepID=UPI0036F0A258
MRFRGKTIRRKIVVLLLVPLLALTAIWAFTTVVTGREARELLNVRQTAEKVGLPAQGTARALQEERRRTLIYLADPRASNALAALRRSRQKTDGVLGVLYANAQDAGIRGKLDGDARRSLDALVEGLDGVGSLRRSVEEGTINRMDALGLYNRLVDPCYTLLSRLTGIDDVELTEQGRALVTVAQAREFLSREDALIASSLVAKRFTGKEIRTVSDLIAQRNLLYRMDMSRLPRDEQDRYERYWQGADTDPLRKAEYSVSTSRPDAPTALDAKEWSNAANKVLADLAQRDDGAWLRYHDRVEPEATAVLIRAALAGVVGLLALVVSVALPVRIGRGLVRDLRRLRLEAHEASGVRLPGVMRRLAAGEQIDLETEAPRLSYERSEIGEVGQALNTLQRAAVEAAVKQAELRRGVSEVFVNLARRSQVLLHKQLTLLDTMERRTEDTDELADLFRLDHLTTRMRRHAEGLVILSGAAPSRQWRKPVQLMDVVRASVAEVEDYERIEVRRLPRLAVAGPAVADLTHLIAELLENATVFSPPHTAVQVLGERVANGFTLEIHDRGLGMAPELLLDANLRLAETPEFELSDTDRLGLFVVSRLAQRQHIRVSLQPSPYGGTTAVVFLPDTVLTEDQDSDGSGLCLDAGGEDLVDGCDEDFEPPAERTMTLTRMPSPPADPAADVLDGPVELEPPLPSPRTRTDRDATRGEDRGGLGELGDLGDEDSEIGSIFRHRRPMAPVPSEHQQAPDDRVNQRPAARGDDDRYPAEPSLSRRPAPKLVSSHGRPVTGPREPDFEPPTRPGELPRRRRSGQSTAHGGPAGPSATGPAGPAAAGPAPAGRGLPHRESRFAGRDDRTTGPDGGTTGHITGREDRSAPAEARNSGQWQGSSAHGGPAQGAGGPGAGDRPVAPSVPAVDTPTASLPRRVRQASLAPQLRDDPNRHRDRSATAGQAPSDRDADEVRNRMASLQRGWQRGREENTATDDTGGAARTTSEGDAR